MLACARKVRRRNFREVLSATVGAQDEIDGRTPLHQIFRQCLSACNIALARGIGNGSVGAHQVRKKILHLAFTRIAATDSHALPRRRRIEREAGLRRELG